MALPLSNVMEAITKIIKGTTSAELDIPIIHGRHMQNLHMAREGLSI